MYDTYIHVSFSYIFKIFILYFYTIKRIFKYVVAITFQNMFYLELYQNSIFLFQKNYF
jgi:hypothetical protein